MKKFEIVSGSTKAVFDEDLQSYSIKTGLFELKNLSPVLKLGGKTVSFGRWKTLKTTAKTIEAEADGRYGKFNLKFSFVKAGVLTLNLKGKLKEQASDVALYYFDGIKISADHVLVQDITMGNADAFDLTQKKLKKDFSCALQIMITKKGEQLQLSYPLMCDHIPRFSGIAATGKISDFTAGSEIKHYSPKTLALEPLTFKSGNGFVLMTEYADENTKEKRDFTPFIEPGWNSWDYYRWTITEDEVLANAEFIAADPVLSKHVKKIIVDDGWQYAYGEWGANNLFPHGMKYLADKIKKLGFKPGLWIAPTLVEPHARIAQLDPDMLAKAESGLPTLCFNCMKRNTFILDPTVPKSQKFIHNIFDEYASMGYEYFKLDFLGATTSARRFADEKIPRGKLMDYTIGLARKAVAGRAALLGCNYMFCGGSSFVDAVRIGGDVHSVWNSIKENTPSIASRFWANKKLWLNDPDFALCRSFDTSNDPDLTRLMPSLVFIDPANTDKNHPGLFKLVDIYRPQAEVLLSLVVAAGGAVNLSDNIPRLNEAGLDLARRTVSAESGSAAIPLDLFSSELPSYWLQKAGDSFRVLLINWTDEKAERVLDLEALGLENSKAVNFWNDCDVPVRNGRIALELAPRSCLFATLK